MRRYLTIGIVVLSVSCVASGQEIDFESVRLAVEDLRDTFGTDYTLKPKDEAHLLETDFAALQEAASNGNGKARLQLDRLSALATKALLANPLIDFDRLLLIQRNEDNLGLPANWESNSSLAKFGYKNELVSLSPVHPDGNLTTVYKPKNRAFVSDVDLHWDGDRLLFSMPGDKGQWQVHELDVSGGQAGTLRQLPLIHEPKVDNYDACYLPDGNLLFSSTAPFVGVPCVTGSSHVSNLYLFQPDTGNIRRLTFEQDHDWCPTVMNNGRVLYLRWEYTDLPHYVSRILFHMNPDGTGQMAYYGSNSYWPNSMFYARPIPDHASQFVAIVSGHHDTKRMGELVLFDAERGRHEADGAVQRIPGRGKPVEPIIRDGLVQGTWPMYLHPWPLSNKYFIVACKPNPETQWGLYLVDVFDNRTLIKETPGDALLEPIPWRPTPKPPAIPPKIDAESKEASVFMADVYEGPGLAGIPRGTVKRLRLVTYHFSYHGVGGQINRVGLDGPWDIKRVIGTVPVEEDGSAVFNIPANTPISLQPLDKEGRAVQLMRSWFTAMPGEVISCVGCHENHEDVAPVHNSVATRRAPTEVTPWYGPTRGFSFVREVQPVLDKYCVSCHDDSGAAPPDLRDQPFVPVQVGHEAYVHGSKFPPSYVALRSYVRAPSIESDMHLLPAMEFHAGTTELVQLLEGDHHGVELDAESWDRLNTWIDLHAPAHGTWREIVGEEKVAEQRQLRMAMLAKYTSNRTEDPEAIGEPAQLAAATTANVVVTKTADTVSFPTGVPDVDGPVTRVVDLGGGVTLNLVRLPAGVLEMGGDATPVDREFWMGAFEVTNAQYRRFDPDHDSRLEHGDFLQFSEEERGYTLNKPDQPVVRVTWNQAKAFCDWLSERTGETFELPSEAQWEWACRAGTATPMSFGDVDVDFAQHANLADARLRQIDTYEPWKLPSGGVPPYRPAVESVNDTYRVSAPVGSFAPNAWGLYDMHGNAAEWTASTRADKRIVRGGSWHDRPKRATSASRQVYQPWQQVFNVGFRVVCNATVESTAVARAAN